MQLLHFVWIGWISRSWVNAWQDQVFTQLSLSLLIHRPQTQQMTSHASPTGLGTALWKRIGNWRRGWACCSVLYRSKEDYTRQHDLLWMSRDAVVLSSCIYMTNWSSWQKNDIIVSSAIEITSFWILRRYLTGMIPFVFQKTSSMFWLLIVLIVLSQ
jgi:hypothetical protein